MKRLPFFLTAVSVLSASAFADIVSSEATANGTILPTGPRSGTNNATFFNVEGASFNANASFGVIDFSASSFNLAFPATDVTSLSLSLTESNAAFTTASGGLIFYLVTDTTSSISLTGTAAQLKFQAANAPQGLGTQLGTHYELGTGNFSPNSGSNGSGTVDTYSLTLDADAKTYFLNQLNNAGTIRLVVAPTDTTGASTWAGVAHTTYAGPTLSFDVTLDQPILVWIGGNGTWNATGGTDWSGGAWNPDKTAVFNTGSGTLATGTPITTVGARFDVDGYEISGTNALTLSGSAGGNVVSITNAADTAIISAPISGTSGLVKNGSGTLALAGANTFTGTVNVLAGSLTVESDANFGNAANPIALSPGGTLKSAAPLVVGPGHTLTGAGTIDASAGDIEFGGPINLSSVTIAADSFVAFSGSSAALSGAALGENSVLTIAAPVTSTSRTGFTGNGTVVLDADNSSFTSGFTMTSSGTNHGPTVVIGSSTALGTGQLRLNGGELRAAADLTGADAIDTEISLGANATLSGSDMELNNFGFFGSPHRLTVDNHTTILSAIITGTTAGGNALIKTGTGTLTLAGSNTYADGTQVLDGTLEVALGGSLGKGNVIVSPENPTFDATLVLGYEFSIDDSSNVFLTSNGTTFGVIDLDFDSSLFETINSLTIDGVPVAAGDYDALDLPNFLTGTGNLRVLSVIPEPGTLGMAALGLMVLTAWGWRRSRLYKAA